MVGFGFTEAQEMFRSVVKDFVRRELMPTARERRKLDHLPHDILKVLADAGLLGLRIPEKYGGQMSDSVTVGIACEEVSKVDNAASLAVVAAVFAGEVLLVCPEEVQIEWMSPCARGDKMMCFCLTEPDIGSDVTAMSTRAVCEGDSYVLNGEKTSISWGMQADVAIVWAKTDPLAGSRGVTIFLVPLTLPGVRRIAINHMGLRPMQCASISLDNVRVPSRYRVGGEGEGFIVAMKAFDWIRVLLSLQVLALGEQSVYDAIDYAKQRKAFGNPIAKYDAVSFRLVDSLAKIEAAKLLCYKALWLRDQGKRTTKETAMAKAISPAIGIEACNNAMITFGHVGYSSEHPVEQRLRDAYGYQFMDGTADIQKIVLVRELIGKEYLNYR